MSKSLKKSLPFAESMLASLEPLIQILDDNPLRIPSSSIGAESLDTGHEKASAKDIGLRIMLDGWLRPIHQQLHGKTPELTNQGYAHTTFKTSEQRLEEELGRFARRGKDDRYEIDMDAACVDGRVMRAQSYYAINDARLAMLNEFYDSLRQVYVTVTGEQWKWVDLQTQSSNAQINASQKARSVDLKAFAERRLIKQATAS